MELHRTNKIVLEVELSGAAWMNHFIAEKRPVVPGSFDGALNLGYRKTGMYEVTFDQLAASGVEGPFTNVDIGNLRLYFRSAEQPIEVISEDTKFNSGDKIRYFVDHLYDLETIENVAVLTHFDVYDSNQNALRYGTVDGDPAMRVPASVFSTVKAKPSSVLSDPLEGESTAPDPWSSRAADIAFFTMLMLIATRWLRRRSVH